MSRDFRRIFAQKEFHAESQRIPGAVAYETQTHL